MERITINVNGSPLSVIPTEGAHVDNRGKIAGLFMSEDDARSMDADKLAWGSVAWDSLTADQQAVATRNTESL